jgi:hypothetical protein
MSHFGRSTAPVLLVGLAALLVACSPAATEEPAVTEPAAPAAMPPNPNGIVEGKVTAPVFGTHVGLLSTGTQPLPPRAGAIRLWDSGVAWRELEPVEGQVNWQLLDTAVAQAEQTGAEDILWVHGSTPAWAAQDPEAAGLYGPGTSSAPREEPYLAILRQVAERYKGRITSYQAWNEANIKIFYRGKADYLAALTAGAKEVLDEVDPDALLVGASTTVRAKGPVKDWYGEYSAGLAQRGWPVDAMAVHLYPLADQGAEERAGYARLMRAWLAERGWTGPVWDTEVNYGDRRDFAKEIVVVPQEQAVAWVARTYIDSLALGVDRTYWYSWNDHILGVDQVDPQTNEILPAGQSFLTVQDWLVGAQWGGCEGELMNPTGDEGAVTVCSVTTASGVPAQILFSHRGTAEVPLPEGAAEVCRLDGTCAPPEGADLALTEAPVLVRLGA